MNVISVLVFGLTSKRGLNNNTTTLLLMYGTYIAMGPRGHTRKRKWKLKYDLISTGALHMYAYVPFSDLVLVSLSAPLYAYDYSYHYDSPQLGPMCNVSCLLGVACCLGDGVAMSEPPHFEEKDLVEWRPRQIGRAHV